MNQQDMLKSIADTFGSMGVDEVQIGSTVIQTNKPKLGTLVGYGDTLKVGDVFFEYFLEYPHTSMNGLEQKGPFKFEGCRADLKDPCYHYMDVNGHVIHANYRGSPWKREFKLADAETTKKFNNAMKYHGLNLRVLFSIIGRPDIEVRSTLIPACYIAWVGNLKKAIATYNTPYGIMGKKPTKIEKWIKSKFYLTHRMNSAVAIPKDFPVKIE